MKKVVKLSALAVCVLAIAGLSACGGGGGSGSSNSSATTDVSYSTYIGKYTAVKGLTGTDPLCIQGASGAKLASTGQFVYHVYKMNIASVSGSTMTGSTSDLLYSDSACTQLLSTQTRNATFVVGSSTAVGSGSGFADQVTINEAALGGGISSGTTINLNGIIFPGDYFTKTYVTKDIFQLTGNRLRDGNSNDSNTFPSSLTPDDSWIKS